VSKLPPTGPSLARYLRAQKRAADAQRNSSAFSNSTLSPGGQYAAPSYVDTGDANTLATAQAYTDASSAKYGLEAPFAALTITAATVTAVPWGAPSENTGGYVVSGGNITVPAGMGGVYAITVNLSVAASQATRAFVNLYPGTSRIAGRGVFTGDSTGTASITARVADLGIIKAEIYCATATSLNGGWITLYRLHS